MTNWLAVFSIAGLLIGGIAFAQDKKVGTTLEDDWKVLLQHQWVNSKPSKAWDELPEKWKKSLAADGVKEWTKVVVTFVDLSDDFMKERRVGYAFSAKVKGKEEVKWVGRPGLVLELQEEKGERFLVVGGKEKTKVRYTLKEGVLTLSGALESPSDTTAPVVVTGEYTGVKKK
jgi:hypothetical protein